MADFYAKMQGIATSLLTRFNQGVIELGVVTPGAGPAHNPGASTQAPWRTVKGAANSAYSVRGGSNSFADGTLIKEGDLKVTLAVSGAAPKPGDVIRFGGDGGPVYRVYKFVAVPATGTAAAWVCYVRRG